MLNQRAARGLWRRFSTKPQHGTPFPSKGTVPGWANIDPWAVSAKNPHNIHNFLAGTWTETKHHKWEIDPMNGDKFLRRPEPNEEEIQQYVASSRTCPKTGLHNALKNPERYIMWGEICHQAGHELGQPESLDFMAKLISRVMPKSYYQAWYEVKVTADFLKNFGGDNPRFLAGGFNVSGDHLGQESRNYRWPFGPVAIVSPFNFPLEIPTLQLIGALIMGNRPVLKCASTVSVVMEQVVRLLLHCGMPRNDMDFFNGGGRSMGTLINSGVFRTTQFTGSCEVAEQLAKETHGKVKVEDAGFDWKILGPDVLETEFVAWQCDQDAYAASGQKCSAQSILFAHKNWVKAGIFDKIKALADKRKLSDLTIGPVLSHTTEDIMQHKDRLLSIPGARLVCGGTELTNHTIPKVYGAVHPTAVFVPLKELLKKENFSDCCREIFGPFQVVTEYDDSTLSSVLEATERMSHHLTAAVVSNDPRFITTVLGNTVNGTTYTGIRARTTAAPQNHWFGPAGDPRGAGIGTPYAIQMVWSCHREVIDDHHHIPSTWKPISS